jgi:ABC-type enterochelin transport system substrate-binding protein
MAKYVYVQLYASAGGPTPPPLKIRADKIEKSEREGNAMIVSVGAERVGMFQAGSVQGWWIQDEEGLGATF